MGRKSPTCVRLLSFAAFLLAVIAAPCVQAHQTAMSTLNVEIRPKKREVDMLLATSASDLGTFLNIDPNNDGFIDHSELPKLRPEMAAYIGPKLRVDNDGEPCRVLQRGFVKTKRRMAALLYRKTYKCDRSLGKVTVTNRVMLDAKGGYTHYGQIQLGKDVHTTVFDLKTPTYSVQVSKNGKTMDKQGFFEIFKDYVWQGVLHILSGIDHILFVICLLFAAGEFRRLLKVITSFTVAHSITLAISALDIFTVPPKLAEPLIALSIAWVAVELLFEQARHKGDPDHQGTSSVHGRHLFVLTFCFGLLHGFGFSYVLRDAVGLPTDALAPALFSFNVGVELGQIAVVCAAYPVVVFLRNKEWGWRAVQVISAAVLLVSLYWFVVRLV